jgi:hypothetical protein
MKYVLACFFGLLALLPLVRAFSGLRSGVVNLKLYLPLARRAERPVLYWTFICCNLLAFASFAFALVFMLWRVR